MSFEKDYKKALDDLQPSVQLKEKLLKSEEVKRMQWNKKKVVIVAAVACLALGTTAFAAGKIVSYRSWGSPLNEIQEYDKAVEKSEELGSECSIPQAFSNGYTFDAANVIGVEGLDENGNVMVNGNEFTARYTKASMPDISMFIGQVYAESDESYVIDSKEIGNVKVCLDQATYKFVPADYELTEEDKQNLEDSHYEISYGSDQVEIMQYNGIYFENNGKYYSMFAWDSDLSAEEWYAMAEELLGQ